MRTQSNVQLLVAVVCMCTSTSAMAAENLPRLIDLGAHQCIPCKMMAPILEELKRECAGKLEVEFIDVWQKEHARKGEEYGIKVIPTQIFLSADGKELWRHEGYISKEGILEKWAELGVNLRPERIVIERWEPAQDETRPPDQICYMCGGDISLNDLVTVRTGSGDVNICSPHHLFVMLSCLQKDVEKTEASAYVTDVSTGKMAPALSAVYVRGLDSANGRPTIKAFANRAAAIAEQTSAGGIVIGYDVLKRNELEPRCGFCDRAVYPQDASRVKVGPGLHTWGCCAHCALGVAARMGMDVEVLQPDALTGEIITIRTMNGSVASLEPEGAVAWFGQKKRAAGTPGSAGCFHQGTFVSQEHLKRWLEKHPLETGCEITIEKALADKMKLSPAQIRKACKIGECSPQS